MSSTERQPKVTNQPFTIRPFQPMDTDLEAALVRGLSSKNKCFRFLGGVKELTQDMLESFCDVDFEQSAAFVAVTEENGKEIQIGVARYAPNTLDDVREMAVVVADEWRDQDVGSLLTQRLIDFAKNQGINKLYSVDLADNTHMRQLAKQLGMSTRRDPEDSHQVIYAMSLQTEPAGPATQVASVMTVPLKGINSALSPADVMAVLSYIKKTFGE